MPTNAVRLSSQRASSAALGSIAENGTHAPDPQHPPSTTPRRMPPGLRQPKDQNKFDSAVKPQFRVIA